MQIWWTTHSIKSINIKKKKHCFHYSFLYKWESCFRYERIRKFLKSILIPTFVTNVRWSHLDRRYLDSASRNVLNLIHSPLLRTLNRRYKYDISVSSVYVHLWYLKEIQILTYSSPVSFFRVRPKSVGQRERDVPNSYQDSYHQSLSSLVQQTSFPISNYTTASSRRFQSRIINRVIPYIDCNVQSTSSHHFVITTYSTTTRNHASPASARQNRSKSCCPSPALQPCSSVRTVEQ